MQGSCFQAREMFCSLFHASHVNGQHYSAVFQKGGSTWEVVAVSVQLKAGENTIIVSRKDGGVTGMWVDYIEFQ